MPHGPELAVDVDLYVLGELYNRAGLDGQGQAFGDGQVAGDPARPSGRSPSLVRGWEAGVVRAAAGGAGD